MKENELHSKLEKHNIDLSDACGMIYDYTKVFIRPDHIKRRFESYRGLSKTQTALFMMLFRDLEVRKNGSV